MVPKTFNTTVAGIPCQCEVSHISGPTPWRQHTFAGAGPGDCDPPEPGEFNFSILDRKGYHAEWLERKLTHQDEARLLDEFNQKDLH